MARLYANNCSSTLAGSISDSATSLTLATGDGAKFPSPTGGDYFDFTLEQGTTREIARCTARSGDVLTITRAVEAIAGVGAVAAAFTAGATVAIRTTAASLNTFVAGMRDSLSGVYTPMVTSFASTAGGAARTLNQLNIYPIIVAETIALDRLGTYCNTPDASNATAVMRFGVWAHDAANARPGTLLVDGGTVSVFSGGARFVEVTVSLTLEPGIYWVGAAAQGSANVASVTIMQSNTTVHMVPIKRTTTPSAANFGSITSMLYDSVSGAFSTISADPTSTSGASTLVWLRHT